jgi:hypothetical protein
VFFLVVNEKAGKGLSIPALAAEMLRLGAVDAAALDGGRSVSLAVGGSRAPLVLGGGLKNNNDGEITTFFGIR